MPHEPHQTPVILDRQSIFQRKSPASNTSQLIAANIDNAFIVSSCNQDFNLSRIERYLALVKEAQVSAVLVLTKTGLINDSKQQTYLAQLRDLQSHLVVLTVNAQDSADCQQLADWLTKGQTTVLLDSSGLGKTTLTNTLCGRQEKTMSIREDDSKGKHTTTGRSLFFTLAGGLILNCLGMRELQLTDCEGGVRALFANIEELAAQCNFSNCNHVSEPGCIIQKAMSDGLVEKRRWLNYQKMLQEQARNTKISAEFHKKDRELGRLIKTTQSAKRNRLN
jgi:ribosome biogenesis GTPase